MAEYERLNHPYTLFGFFVFWFYLLFWGAQWLFPGNVVSSVVVVLVTIAGVVLIRPGWNIRPRRPAGYWAVLFGALLGSAVLAAYGLKWFRIPTPYDTMTLKIVTIFSGVVAVACVEEVLFRQVMFRWLERQGASARGVVFATSVAFGCAHLGPVFTGGPVDGPFFSSAKSNIWCGLACYSESSVEPVIRGARPRPTMPHTIWQRYSFSPAPLVHDTPVLGLGPSAPFLLSLNLQSWRMSPSATAVILPL